MEAAQNGLLTKNASRGSSFHRSYAKCGVEWVGTIEEHFCPIILDFTARITSFTIGEMCWSIDMSALVHNYTGPCCKPSRNRFNGVTLQPRNNPIISFHSNREDRCVVTNSLVHSCNASPPQLNDDETAIAENGRARCHRACF